MALGRDAAERLARLPDLDRPHSTATSLEASGSPAHAQRLLDTRGRDRGARGPGAGSRAAPRRPGRAGSRARDPQAVADADDLVARARVAPPARPVRELVSPAPARRASARAPGPCPPRSRRARRRRAIQAGQRLAGRGRRRSAAPRSSQARRAARPRSCGRRSERSSARVCSGACSRAATTAAHAGQRDRHPRALRRVDRHPVIARDPPVGARELLDAEPAARQLLGGLREHDHPHLPLDRGRRRASSGAAGTVRRNTPTGRRDRCTP